MRLSTSQNDQRPPMAFLLVGIHAKSQQEVAIDAAFIIVLFHHYEQLLLSPIGIFCRLFLFLKKIYSQSETFPRVKMISARVQYYNSIVYGVCENV